MNLDFVFVIIFLFHTIVTLTCPFISDQTYQFRHNILYSWGDGSLGQLGHNSVDTYARPKRLRTIKEMNVVAVSTSKYHTGDHTYIPFTYTTHIRHTHIPHTHIT